MKTREEQLRELFGLDESEELHGDFSCAHTKPRWGASFQHGHMYIFSSCMVFHAIVKAVRICFKDVKVIRKRNFMRMPNTIAVERTDGRQDVFTSFVFARRQTAFEKMVWRWRVVNPDMADAYLGPITGYSTCGSVAGDSEDLDLDQEFSQQAASAAAASRGQQDRWQAAQPQQPFPRQWHELLLPAAAGTGAAAGAVPEGVDMEERASCVLHGSAQQVAEILLSDTSGFLPHAMQQQGNELVSITPWQVAPNQSGALQRTFKYIYSTTGSFGPVRSIVIQQQQLRLFADGRVTLDVTQSMPDLPMKVGKAVNVIIRWEMMPNSSSDSSSSGGRSGSSTPVVAATTPATHAAAAAGVVEAPAAVGRSDGSVVSTPKSIVTQQQQQQGDFDQSRSVTPLIQLGDESHSFMGLGADSAAATAVQPPGSSSGSDASILAATNKQHLLLQLHAESCPQLHNHQQQQVQQGHSDTATAASDAGSEQQQQQVKSPQKTFSLPVLRAGQGSSSKHSNGHDNSNSSSSRHSSFFSGLKDSFRDLRSPLHKKGNSTAAAAAAEWGSEFAPAGSHAGSTTSGSALESVHESVLQEQDLQHEATARNTSFSSSRGRDQVGPAAAAAATAAAAAASAGKAGQPPAADASISGDAGARHHLLHSLGRNSSRSSSKSSSRSSDPSQRSSADGGGSSSKLSRRSPPLSPRATAALAASSSAAALLEVVGIGGNGLSQRSSMEHNHENAQQQQQQQRQQQQQDGGSNVTPVAAPDGASSLHPTDSIAGGCIAPAAAGNGSSPAPPAAAADDAAADDAVSSSSSSSMHCQVSIGLHWVGKHMAWRTIQKQTMDSTSESQQQVMDHAVRWMEVPSERRSLSEVMPQAARAAMIPAGPRRHGHRRSGSAGSAGRPSPGGRSLSLSLAPASSSRGGLPPRHSMAQHANISVPEEGARWWSGLVGVVEGVGGVCVDTAVAAGGVCKGVGQQVGVVGGVVLVLGLGHMLLLWKVLQLLTVLIHKLDALELRAL